MTSASPHTLTRRFPGLEIRVEGTPEILDELRGLLPESLAWVGAMKVHGSSIIRLAAGDARHQVLSDGKLLWSGRLDYPAAPVLEWAIAHTVAERMAARYLLFHAGAVGMRGQGLILPGASGSGKSTLVAGLLAAGWTYFSDDLAAVDLATLSLLPIQKALCIKGTALPLLEDRLPALRAARPYRRFATPEVRYALPAADRLPESSLPVRFLVFPRYSAGAALELAPIPRTNALERLLETCSNPQESLPAIFDPLLAMLRRVAPYRLVHGNLDDAIVALSSLAAAP
ncbi:MAG TPA: hypothetical protein VNL35_06060 [Chloroflexota bacterium]|nr:hypothetical protein [Chloroflexota bacterium]